MVAGSRCTSASVCGELDEPPARPPRETCTGPSLLVQRAFPRGCEGSRVDGGGWEGGMVLKLRVECDRGLVHGLGGEKREDAMDRCSWLQHIFRLQVSAGLAVQVR